MNETHEPRIYPEYFVGHLRKGRLQTLTVTMRANTELQLAIRCQSRTALFVPRDHGNAPTSIHRRSMSSLFAKDRKADANPPAIRLR